MNDPSADPAQQKQRLRERLRFRRKHFVANLDAIARLAAFRALPQPLADLIADRDPIAAYIAWGDEPDILPMLAGIPLALTHHPDRAPAMTFRHWADDGTLAKGQWRPHQPGGDAECVTPVLQFSLLRCFSMCGLRPGPVQ